MKKEFEKLCEIFEIEHEECRGNTHTYLRRKDCNRRVQLYDVFLETLQILEESGKIKK